MLKTSGIILSGGKSARMGSNKSLLTVKGKPVIQHIAEEMQSCNKKVAVIANNPDIYRFLGVRVISDRYSGKGPLAGIETALYHTNADAVMLAACDMPFINRDVYRYLLRNLNGFDAVVPVFGNYTHPLSGIYKKHILETITDQINKNNLQVKSVFEYIRVNYIYDFANLNKKTLQMHFFNMNTPDQYKEAEHLAQISLD